MESLPVTFNSTADFGKRTTVTIPMTGDLLYSVWLEVTVPDLSLFQPKGGGVTLPTTATNITYCNSVGLAVVKTCELDIGGTKVDSITGQSVDVQTELTLKEEKRQGFNEMIGRYDDFNNADPTKSSSAAKTYFFPVQFYFHGETYQSIPLVSLQKTQVVINFEFRTWMECVKSSTASIISMVDAQGNPPSLNIECFADQVFLGAIEKSAYVECPLEYLITTTQIQEESVLALAPNSGQYAYQVGSVNRRINLNHTGPIKELVWTYISAVNNSIDSLYGNNWFEYSLPPPYKQTNPFDFATLYFNGAVRQKGRIGEYYRQVTNYERHTRVPKNRKMILTFPLSLYPEDQCQPSSSANFTRIQQPYFNFQMNPNIQNGIIRIFGYSWNVVGIAQGSGGLRYSNH